MKKVLALVLAVLFVMTGVAMAEESKGTLTMATNCAFPPYEYYDDETGEPTGIDVELVKMVCAELGYEVEVVDMDFGAVVSGVQTGKYDIGAGAITINEERKQMVDFTDPYEITVQQVIVGPDSPFTSMDDLYAAEGFKIGVQQDTTGDLYASDTFESTGKASVERYKTGTDAVLALTSGKIDCVLIDNGPALAYVAKNEGLQMFASDCDSEEYGFCFSKENAELTAAFNEVLNKLIADGTVDEIIAEFNAKML